MLFTPGYTNNSFNTQPPEGGWNGKESMFKTVSVSTHSRPKAAVAGNNSLKLLFWVSTHSRPKAAVKTYEQPAT